MSEKDIGRQLCELNNLIHREIRKNPLCENNEDDRKNAGISFAGSCIIAYLHDHSHKDIFQRDLECEFQVRRSTMSKVLTVLEQKDYIKRVDVSYDKRLKKIVLTKKALKKADKLKADRETLELKMTSGISKEELSIFKETLEKIKNNLRQEETK
ncbi:MAG: winged helix-turn-helix transcriptional regulator [Ruminococcus sp.]|nr:winged helix-turn-helix transcriptional regulator [Ruminococcus sp.]